MAIRKFVPSEAFCIIETTYMLQTCQCLRRIIGTKGDTFRQHLPWYQAMELACKTHAGFQACAQINDKSCLSAGRDMPGLEPYA